jgi:hypothetical protein
MARPEAHAIPITQPEPSIPACGARSTSDITLSERPAPEGKFARVIRSGGDFGILDFRILKGKTEAEDRFYTLAEGGRLRIYDHRFRQLRETQLGEVKDAPSIALDPDGNVYAATQSRLVKFTPSGKLVWKRPSNFGVEGYVYGYDSGSGYRIGVINKSGSEIFDTEGRQRGRTPVTGRYVNQSEATGNLISASEGYVRVYSRDGATEKFYFGTDIDGNDPGPFHFYVLNAADQLADGTIVVSDTGNGLELFADDGSYLGLAGYGEEADDGVTGFIGYDTAMAVHRGRIYYPVEVDRVNADLAFMTETDVRAYAAEPQGAPGRLGIGAGPFTKAQGNYFPSGAPPQVFLQFHPWWSSVADGLTGEYTIRDLRQLRDKVKVKPAAFTPRVAKTGITDVPITLPSTAPGFYQMDVRLIRSGRTVGADCLNFGIGPAGTSFDPSKLGSGNLAKINLAGAFGLTLFRADFDLSELLSDDPHSPLKFPDSFDAEWKSVSEAAAAKGVTLEVQIATGSDEEKKLIEAGTWGQRVSELVNRLKPYVHAWEPWNEPNATYGGGAGYTAKILKPAYEAIKKSDPTATVVGGAVLGVDLSYIDEMISGNALDYMDVLGIHAYTGHNRSFEEQGTLALLRTLRDRLATAGKPELAIWDTESGFWNSQVSSYLHQGDKLVRKVVLENSVGIDKYNNFLIDGDFTVEGQTWSLWQDKITPGGLAMINFGVQTRGLAFKELLNTDIPHAYAAVYGPPDGDSTLLIAWAEDFSVEARFRGINTDSIVDEWGGVVPVKRSGKDISLTLSGAPIYAQITKGGSPAVSPLEKFGENLALTRNGSTATASSETPWNPPSAAIDGVMDTQDKGSNDEGTSAWIQKYTDDRPELTIDLGQQRQLDRVLVSSQGIDSVQTGLRSYDVQLQDSGGNWKTVANVRDDFLARNHLVHFPAQEATKIRITNLTVNYSGYSFGLKPLTWPRDSESLNQDDVWSGQAVIYEVEAYAPGSASGSRVTSLDNPAEVADQPGSNAISVWWWVAGALAIATTAAGFGAWRMRSRQLTKIEGLVK